MEHDTLLSAISVALIGGSTVSALSALATNREDGVQLIIAAWLLMLAGAYRLEMLTPLGLGQRYLSCVAAAAVFSGNVAWRGRTRAVALGVLTESAILLTMQSHILDVLRVLPLQVVRTTLSYVLLVLLVAAFAIVADWQKQGAALLWRTPRFVYAGLIGVYAFYDLLGIWLPTSVPHGAMLIRIASVTASLGLLNRHLARVSPSISISVLMFLWW